MIEKLLDEAVAAGSRRGGEQEMEHTVHRIASMPEEALDVMIQALNHPDKLRQAVAIEVIRLIGYPKNEPAISYIIDILSDINHPGSLDAVGIFADMEPDRAVSYLIHALINNDVLNQIDQGDVPTRETSSWQWRVYGIAALLDTVEPVYTLLCGPAINYVLTRLCAARDTASDHQFLVDSLLGMVKRGGEQLRYVLPALIALAKHKYDRFGGEQIKKVIYSFSPESLAPYRLLLQQVE